MLANFVCFFVIILQMFLMPNLFFFSKKNKLSCPEVILLFSCSTQLSTKFQMLIKTKIPTIKFLAFSLLDIEFIMLINVKMPTIVGILTLMSRINFVLS